MTGQGCGKRCGIWRIAMIGAGALLLAGCDDTGQFNNPFKAGQAASEETVAGDRASVKLVERDVLRARNHSGRNLAIGSNIEKRDRLTGLHAFPYFLYIRVDGGGKPRLHQRGWTGSTGTRGGP